MRHRLLALFLAFALALSLGVSAADAVDAVPSTSPLLVDGEQVSCGAYAITAANGYANNYFKLRDVAKLLSGTRVQFNVTWDGAANAIRLETGKPYVEVGGELAAVPAGKAAARPNASAVYLNGRRITLEGYTIAQNNYFKLRDLGSVLGFSVSWNSEKGAIQVESKPFEMKVVIADDVPVTIDPALATDADDMSMIAHLFEGLMTYADDGNGNAALTPGLAKSYATAANADGTVTYTFALRPDACWSDGKRVTADDFVYSWRRVLDPNTAADYSYILEMVVHAGEVMTGERPPEDLAIKAVDPSTLEVTVWPYVGDFLGACAHTVASPVREDMVSRYGDKWTLNTETYLSTGAYHLTPSPESYTMRLEKNPYYYDLAAVGPQAINFDVSGRLSAALSEFRSGEVDFISQFFGADIVQTLATGEMQTKPYAGTYFCVFNTQQPPFDDPLVRQAFLLSVDRNYIVDTVTRAGEAPAGGYVAEGVYDAVGAGSDFRAVGGEYYDTSAAAYPANCEKARQLLAQAGYPGGEGFPIVTYLYNSSDAHQAVGEALQAMWQRELGVTVKLEAQEWATFLWNRSEGNYQIARNGWINDYNDPAEFLEKWLSLDFGYGNEAQYDNPAYDMLVEQTWATEDPARRMAIFHQAEDMLMEDAVVCPIFFYKQRYMLSPQIEGMVYNPLGFFYFQHCHLK